MEVHDPPQIPCTSPGFPRGIPSTREGSERCRNTPWFQQNHRETMGFRGCGKELNGGNPSLRYFAWKTQFPQPPTLDLRFPNCELQMLRILANFPAKSAPSFYACRICIKGQPPRGSESFYAYSICIKGRGQFRCKFNTILENLRKLIGKPKVWHGAWRKS